MNEKYNAFEIQKYLKTNIIGKNIQYTDLTASTNDLAKENHAMNEGTVFAADNQSAGKGRMGRSWQSESRNGIYMSILLKPQIKTEDIPKITLIAGLAVCRSINGAKIKYPNDIIADTKKICGILCEMSADEKGIKYVICGIGVNVNNESFDEELSQKATSIYLYTGKKQSRAKLVAKILNEFEILYNEFLESGISNLLDEYRKNCVNIGKEVRVTYENKEIIGKCTDITDGGAIIVKTADDEIKINTGDISVRGIYGYV